MSQFYTHGSIADAPSSKHGQATQSTWYRAWNRHATERKHKAVRTPNEKGQITALTKKRPFLKESVQVLTSAARAVHERFDAVYAAHSTVVRYFILFSSGGKITQDRACIWPCSLHFDILDVMSILPLEYRTALLYCQYCVIRFQSRLPCGVAFSIAVQSGAIFLEGVAAQPSHSSLERHPPSHQTSRASANVLGGRGVFNPRRLRWRVVHEHQGTRYSSSTAILI